MNCEGDGLKHSKEEIKIFWDHQAILDRQASSAALEIHNKQCNIFSCKGSGGTSKDLILKKLEKLALSHYIQESNVDIVLEVGCGSGVMTIELAEALKNIKFVGCDFSHEMITNALKNIESIDNSVTERLEFREINALELSSQLLLGKFKLIFTDRCFINLPTWIDQQHAIREVHTILPQGGTFLMLEGSKQGLDRLNSVRKDINLEPIETVWHNLFFDEEKLIPFVSKLFHVQNIDNFCSTYMLVSRSLHPKLQKPKYDAPINQIGALLPNMGDYGYLKIFVLVKK